MLRSPALGRARNNEVLRAGTLSQALFPQRTMLRHAALVIAAALFIALAAQASIRVYVGPVPISGVTFGVLLVGGLLGPRLGMSAGVLYVAMGVFGLPVYAEGSHGWAVISGSTGGYIISYPFVTLLVGWLAQRGWDRRPAKLALAMLFGNALIYAFGLPWLYFWGENNEALLGVNDMTAKLTLEWGLVPFIPGDLAKLLLAAALVPSGWQLLRGIKLGPARMLRGETSAPPAAHLGLVAIGAALAMALGAVLPWSPGELGVAQGAGWLVLAAGLLGAMGVMMRQQQRISAGVAQLWGFVAGATGGLVAFVNLVTFNADGTLSLGDISFGVVISVVAAIVFLASTAWEAPTE
jgi:biotin transport system substrate-specific component